MSTAPTATQTLPTPRPAGGEAPAQEPLTPLHQPLLHESGLKHTSGEARYVDDLPAPAGMLLCHVITSPHAHARLTRRDATKARAVPGVHAIYFAEDVPGLNDVGPVIHDEPLFATHEVLFMGQSIGVVVAETYDACRAAAKLVELDFEPLPAITTIDQAIAQNMWLSEPHVMRRGDADAELWKSDVKLEGEVRTGGQDHFYLETQATLALPEEDGSLRLLCSTQHPSEVQAIVSHVLHVGRHLVTVEVPRMGGGFGGKETQAAPFAAMAALAARNLRRPVKIWLNRDQDMAQTGKRHPFLTRYQAGFSKTGELKALKLETYSDGGFSNDLSRAILDRALFHSDNTYFVPALFFTGRVAKTHLPSNTAFRGFGGPQGMAVIETIMSRAAEVLQLEPAEVRRRNFYSEAPRNVTPYYQEVRHDRMPRLWDELLKSSDYFARKAAIETFNQGQKHAKRGLAITPVKFGISFTTSFLNQAGALVVLYADGTVQLNHGGTEMGQGLHTKMLAICAHELGISPRDVRAMNTATDKVPNTSATAASSGTDLNGAAVKVACETLRERLKPVAARLLGVPAASTSDILFAGGKVFLQSRPELALPFAQVTQAAYLAQVSMSATGFYKTPDIHYDKAAGRGKPFHYFAYGAAVSEVELSGLTGEHRLRRVDILHDVGASLVPTIDRGQVEGGFIQGVGWLTCEEVLFDDKGYLLTHSPDTYKIPAFGDAPADFRVSLLEGAPQPDVIHGSKAVGEPPLMLALSVVAALRHAVAAFGKPGAHVDLKMPCTPEALLTAVDLVRSA
ncbi:MAG: xanthine dehydrogenase molybdopterin binding subunit [Myxococcaceae bacterium]|nr:xanthine dehydrogenase molybdopterin binding subunit [Myxococcaceae bacterium]